MEHDFHRELKRQVADYFTDNGWQTFQEFYLPNKTIADVFGYCPHRGFIISEVATTYTASKADRTIRKYQHCCNRLYLAAPEEMKLAIGEGSPLLEWMQRHHIIGLLTLRKGKIQVTREPLTTQLSARTTQQLRDRMDLSIKILESRVLRSTEKGV